MISSRLVILTIGFSLALHFAIYLALNGVRARDRVHGEAMTVSFETITPAQHEEAPRPRVTKSKLRSLKPVPQPTVTAAPTVTPPPAGPAGDPHAVASATGTYIQEVARLLNQNKVFPHASVEREEEGRVLIGLTLGRDGAVLDARVEEHSPFDRLNQAALQTVHNVTHFPAIPELVPAPLHLHVPLLFQIERR